LGAIRPGPDGQVRVGCPVNVKLERLLQRIAERLSWSCIQETSRKEKQTSLFWMVIGAWPVRVQLNDSTMFEHPVLTLCAEEAPDGSKEAPVTIVFPHRAAPSMTVSEFEARLQVDIPRYLFALPGSQFREVMRWDGGCDMMKSELESMSIPIVSSSF
jgi:hypothetical protein